MGSVVALKPDDTIVGEDYWNDISSGKWAEDCQLGRERADTTVERLGRDMCKSPVFLRMMRDMVTKGQFGGVESGFFQRMLELSVTGFEQDARR